MLYTHDQPGHTHRNPVADTVSRKTAQDNAAAFPDQRPEALTQLKLQALADTFSAQQPPIQRKENKTGLPDNLKSGIENLSGYSLDDVKVHYNSAEPANLQAHAFAQGTDIHLAPGQEQHLPHEAWHVVQQKQGRVKATRQLKGKTAINDDAGLEREADTMGAKALQLKATDQQLSQRAGSSPGNVVQLVRKTIGRGDLTNRQGIVDEYTVHGDENTVNWPDKGEEYVFSGEYGGNILRCLHWAQDATEGVEGWAVRNYNPRTFHDLANTALRATFNLTEPELNNDKNKTLVAIRTFRGDTETDMGEQTANDLRMILALVNGAREELLDKGFISNLEDKVREVEADPAEAHPNTLPTARITFDSGATAYFKGRSGRVEKALVGSSGSVAELLSHSHYGPLNSIGTHSFLSKDTWHLSENVGPSRPPGKVKWYQALSGWTSGVRTAVMVMVTGTGDLHSSNILGGKDSKKHIIDAEFLLELTAWGMYNDALIIDQLPQFDLRAMVPGWAQDYVKTLDQANKAKFAQELIDYIGGIGLNDEQQLEEALKPVRKLIDGNKQALLRISPDPIITSYWLKAIADFHNAPGRQDELVEEKWELVRSTFAGLRIALYNVEEAHEELKINFSKGQVPLLHIDASTGLVYLNKQIEIGEVLKERSVEAFLALTKQVVQLRYPSILADIRNVVRLT